MCTSMREVCMVYAQDACAAANASAARCRPGGVDIEGLCRCVVASLLRHPSQLFIVTGPAGPLDACLGWVMAGSFHMYAKTCIV